MAPALMALPCYVHRSGGIQAGRQWLPCHHEDQPEQWDEARLQGRSLRRRTVPRRRSLD